MATKLETGTDSSTESVTPDSPSLESGNRRNWKTGKDRGRAEGVDMVIQIMLAIFLGSILLPIAFEEWFNATTSSWGTGSAALWPVIPVMALIGVLYLFYRKYVD